jgi:aspartate/methionine/tyrosine aminotransferase
MNLCQSIARNYGTQLKRKIDPLREVTVTVGATEALFLAFNAFLNEGDEVIMFEPAFDIYRGAAAMCGAVVRYDKV